MTDELKGCMLYEYLFIDQQTDDVVKVKAINDCRAVVALANRVGPLACCNYRLKEVKACSPHTNQEIE